MKKIIRIGTVKVGNSNGSVFCEIDFEGGRLAISGVIAPLPSGNCRGSCGQIYDELNHISKYAPGWNRGKLDKFITIWKKWHLNELHAGCKHQRALGWEADGYKKHPGERCPECQYKFGTAWFKIKVPFKNVIEWLWELPETDKTPAWV